MTAPSWLARVFGAGAPPRRPGGPLPTPLTRERLAAYLDKRGYHYSPDDDGDLTGSWDEHRFWFILLGDAGEVVQVRGRWARTLPLEQRSQAILVLNDWNRDRIWPKAYLREEEGRLAVYSEVSADLEPGATDQQLAQVLSCGLGSGIQLFTALESLLPGEEPPPDDIPDN